MPELADLLNRADRTVEEAVPLPEVGFDDLTRRRDRRQGNRRIRAGVLGIAIALAVALAGLRAFTAPVVVDEPPRTPAFFVDLDTGKATPLPDSITSIPGASGFQVSPDGSQLLFDTSGDPSAPSQVYIANVDGTDVRQLTEDPEGAVVGAWGDEVRAGGWSPDGSLVTYIGGWGRPTDLDELAERGVMYADTGAAVYLDRPTGRAGDLFGTCVSLDGGLKSYPIPLGGSKYLNVTPIGLARPPGAIVANDVSSCETFSIDGSSILFTKSGSDGSGLNPDLWTGSASPVDRSGERSSLVLEDVSHAWPSPDGATLAASRLTEVSFPHGGTFATEIWLANADGSDPHLLVEGSFSGWSPDGTRILYLGDGVQIIDVASGETTTVGRGTLADWLDDDTVIIEGYEDPASDTETPSVSVVPPAGGDFLLDLATGERSALPEAFTSLDDPSSYAISPDGSSVVFRNAGSQIYVANVDGTAMRLVADQPFGASNPSWSPDGSAIVFVGRAVGSEPGERTILVLDLATGQITPVVDGAATRLWLPSYSPDGGTILFTAVIGGDFGLWTVPATGGEPALLLKGVAFGAYSPDSSTIAYRKAAYRFELDGGSGLADADGSRARTLVAADPSMCPGDSVGFGPELRPNWSPDGTRIALQTRWGGRCYGGPWSGPIHVVDATTGASTVVGNGHVPTWLDDDTLIVESS